MRDVGDDAIADPFKSSIQCSPLSKHHGPDTLIPTMLIQSQDNTNHQILCGQRPMRIRKMRRPCFALLILVGLGLFHCRICQVSCFQDFKGNRPKLFLPAPTPNVFSRASFTRTVLRYTSPGINDDAELSNPNSIVSANKSYVSAIRSCNLAGVIGTNGRHNNEIEVNLNAGSEDGSNLVAVTGETGSGKSLLIATVCQLVTGGKVPSSLLQLNNENVNEGDRSLRQHQTATVEMELQLHQPHVSTTFKVLEKIGLNATSILGSYSQDHNDAPVKLTLKRVLPVLSYTDAERTNKEIAVRSTCTMNGHQVSLKALKAVGSPLIAIVDAPAASAALRLPQSRLRMIDTAVPTVVLVWVRQLQNKYTECRAYRESLEKELENRVLPPSFSSRNNTVDDDGMDLDLLRHWVDELDGFERRISTFCESLCNKINHGATESVLASCLSALSQASWQDNENEGSVGRASFISALYKRLLDLSDTLRAMDDQIKAASSAYDSLASLSSPESARTALERTRNFLLEAITVENKDSEHKAKSGMILAAEKAHHLLNEVEDALSRCARFLDDDNRGLLATLQSERAKCMVDADAVGEVIAEWNTLSRKHGISPYVLPNCHASLRQEYSGNVEARSLLPNAVKQEENALAELKQACQALSRARSDVSRRLSKSITDRLPLLGMDGCTFCARLDSDSREASNIGRAWLGVDSVDFMLFHTEEDGIIESSIRGNDARGGKVDSVGSSGEKARILLGIECEIPGSVGALCGTNNNKEDNNPRLSVEPGSLVSPVAVIYDEIDAHVGGRAAVSVAQMLSQQARTCQVFSITHSPSVAAVADLHIVVQKESLGRTQKARKPDDVPFRDGAVVTTAGPVEGPKRRLELARMASGDMAPEEAEAFADALIRHGAAKKVRQ